MDVDEYRKEIERKVLAVIEEHLQNGDMDADKAQQIAQYVLASLHPQMSLEEISAALPQMAKHFSELAQALLPTIRAHEEQIKTMVSQQVNTLIQQGKITEAHTLLKDTLHKDPQK